MPYEQSEWTYRNMELTGDDFIPVTFWQWPGGSPVRKIRDHEDAAEAVAQALTKDDPCYYEILEREGVKLDIRSPEGEVKRMRAGGYSDFHYTAEEVAG